MFAYIEDHEEVQDVVVSGGDSYTLDPKDITLIGERLLNMPNIKRIRFATKGLAVCPIRIIDPNDGWTNAFVGVSDLGRTLGKEVAMHTHFNHPNEIHGPPNRLRSASSNVTSLSAIRQSFFAASTMIRSPCRASFASSPT